MHFGKTTVWLQTVDIWLPTLLLICLFRCTLLLAVFPSFFVIDRKRFCVFDGHWHLLLNCFVVYYSWLCSKVFFCYWQKALLCVFDGHRHILLDSHFSYESLGYCLLLDA